MKIFKYIHSCVLVEEQTRGLLFDPGKFSFMDGHVKAEKFHDLDAVVITHIHPDHLDVEALKVIIANNPEAQIVTNDQIATQLSQDGLSATVLVNGSLRVGAFTIEALPAPHERTILADSFPDHAAYRINGRLIHPGDSISFEVMAPWKSTEVLLFAAAAPWMNELQQYTFVKSMKPSVAIPIHDGFLKDFFREARYKNYAEFLGRDNITVITLLEPGEEYEQV